MNEDEIIKLLKKDSLKALNEMIIRYTSFVSSVIGRILRNMERDIDELTQDVFLTAWNNRKKIEAGKLKSYLAVIARNKAFSLLRKEHEDLPLEEDILIFDDENIELKIENKELSRLLDEALRELPTAQRELFVRHYYYGQSVAEASSEMDINESTAKSWLKRGREKLKGILIEKGAVDFYSDGECKITGQPVENT